MSITLRGGGPLERTRLSASLSVGFAALAALFHAWRNRRYAYHLSEMPDYILTDLGLKRDDVSQALHCDWREDATYRLAVTAARRRRGL